VRHINIVEKKEEERRGRERGRSVRICLSFSLFSLLCLLEKRGNKLSTHTHTRAHAKRRKREREGRERRGWSEKEDRRSEYKQAQGGAKKKGMKR
jgi:hypothetical protein